MSGPCAGCGIDTTANTISLSGPRSGSWNAGGLSIGTDNGARCDPVTGKLWVPPDALVKGICASATPKSVNPTATGTTLLSSIKVSLTTHPGRKTFCLRNIGSGIAGFRVGDGNWWAVSQSATIKVDGVVPVFGTGTGYQAALENHSGGVMGVATPTAAELFHFEFDPGHTIDFQVDYSLHVFAFAASAANNLQWTPPTISLMMWSRPL